MNNQCPVCLDSFEDSNVLSMPICGHRVHVSCALNAAQYDTRCPICRTKDPSISSRSDDDIFTHIQEITNRHAASLRRYQQRRTRAIRQRDSLKRIRDRLTAERRSFEQVDRELEREWISLQKRQWVSDAKIADIKMRRKKLRRRVTDLNRRLEHRLQLIIGDEPEFGQ